MSERVELFGAHVRPRDEFGSLRPMRCERLCLMLADDIALTDAWRASGGTNSTSSSIAYRRKIVYDPIFKKRLAMLQEERKRMEAEEPYGHAEWACKQTWRVARAADDPKLMLRAAEMLLDIAKMKGQRPPPAPDTPAEPAVEASETPNPVGKPVTKTPTSTRDRSGMMGRLMAVGMDRPAPGSDSEED